jgi:hypothetical protein
MKKQTITTIVLTLLTLIPVLIWSSLEPLGARFETLAYILKSVGQVSALVGTVLFALLIIVRTLQSKYSQKSNFETIALLLLLMHPLGSAVTFVSVSSLANPVPLQWALAFGFYSLGLLLCYVAITFCAGKNNYLQATPHVLSTVLFLGTMHAFFIPSDLSRSPLLQGYVLTVVAAAFVCYTYQIFAKRFGASLVSVQGNKSTNSAL